MTHIGTVEVAAPVYRIDAVVEHSVVRKPTVFERMVMRLCIRAAERPAVGDSTLRRAFEDQLGATGVGSLLESTVAGLVRLQVVKSTSAGTSVLDVPIRALQITPDGRRFYDENMLPSSSTRDHVEYWYLPWSNVLAAEKPRALNSEARAAQFDAEEFQPRGAPLLVRNQLDDDPPHFLKSGSDVADVEVDIDEAVEWRHLEIEVHVSKEGYLQLRVPRDPTLEKWLRGLDRSIVERTFLDQVIGRADGSDVPLPEATAVDIARCEVQPDRALSSSATVEIHIPGGEPLRLQLSEPTRANGAAHAHAPAGLHATRPETFPASVAEAWVEGATVSRIVVVGDLPATWQGSRRYIRVRGELDGAHASALWETFSDDLALSLAVESDPAIALLPLSWGSLRPLDALREHLSLAPLTRVHEVAEHWHQAARQYVPEFSNELTAGWIDAVARSVTSSAFGEAIKPVDAANLVAGLQMALGSSVALDPVRRALVARVSAPVSADEVRALLTLVDSAREIPDHVLGPGVYYALLEAVFEDPESELVSGDSQALRVIENFRAMQARLDSDLGRANALNVREGEALAAVTSLGTALSTANQWLEAAQDPLLARTVGGELPPAVLSLSDGVRKWVETAQTRVLERSGDSRTALVFDTNSLMNYPDALRELGDGEFAVIPNRVVSELDGLKHSSDGERQHKARSAHRTLDDLRDSNTVEFKSSPPLLVPPDLGDPSMPDNQILAVAVAYSAGKVMLVTGDRNLRLKADAMHVAAEGWDEIRRGR